MGKFERHRGKRSAGGSIAALAAMLVVSGCSSVPDYANPVEWYNSTVEFFDEDAPPPLAAETVPGADDPFPELSDTPEPPLRELELGTLDTIGEGLVADRANAQYTDTANRAGGESALAVTPTYQAEAPPLPTPRPTVAPAPQPSPAEPSQPIQSTTQQSVFQPAPPQPAPIQPAPIQPTIMQPAPMQPAPLQLRPVDRGIDVQTMFANLFSSSGPSGVAPAADGTQFAAAPTTSLSAPSSGLPSSAAPLSRGGGQASYGGALLGSSKAAVIYFNRGSTSITKEARDVLHKVADYQKQSGGNLRVVGHASNRTKELSPESHELVNFNISFARARAVADELIRRGVAPDKLKVVAMSDSAPVYREWMPSGEAGNRRAEVFIDF